MAERRAQKIATVATARKLLTLMYNGLRDGHIRALERPRPQREQAQTAIAKTGPPVWKRQSSGNRTG